MIFLGVMGSGSGSNLQAILDAIDDGRLEAEVSLVLSDNPEAYILKRAAERGIATDLIDCGQHLNKFPHNSQVATAAKLKAAQIDLVCLAGFMRLVKQPLLEAFPDRILNIHPSLLPLFPGVKAWEQALLAGAEKTGCTVHLVDEGMDTGPVLGQAEVAVTPGDTAETLHQRIQVAEHQLYPSVISRYGQRLARQA